MANGPGGIVASVELVGGPELVAAFQRLTTQPPEFVAAQNAAGNLLATEARSLAPRGAGTLSENIKFSVGGNLVDVGSYSPYARWFHVPYLSEGGVQAAKKLSSKGRPYTQTIPNNPFMIKAAFFKQLDVFAEYIKGVGAWIDSAMSGVPK